MMDQAIQNNLDASSNDCPESGRTLEEPEPYDDRAFQGWDLDEDSEEDGIIVEISYGPPPDNEEAEADEGPIVVFSAGPFPEEENSDSEETHFEIDHELLPVTEEDIADGEFIDKLTEALYPNAKESGSDEQAESDNSIPEAVEPEICTEAAIPNMSAALSKPIGGFESFFRGGDFYGHTLTEALVATFHRWGLRKAELQTALLTFHTLMGPSLGFPLALVLAADNPLQADRLIGQCLRLVPEDRVIQFSSLNQRSFYTAGNLLAGKSLVCSDLGKLRQAFGDIQRAVHTRGAFNTQVSGKGEERTLNRQSVEGTLGYLAVDRTGKDFERLETSALLVRLKDERDFDPLSLMDDSGGEVPIDLEILNSLEIWIKKARSGKIPLSKELAQALSDSVPASVPNREVLLRFMVSLLRVIVILSRTEPLDVFDITASGLKVSRESFLEKRKIQNPDRLLGIQAGATHGIEPSLSEYSLLHAITKDLFSSYGEGIDETESRVFEALKDFCKTAAVVGWALIGTNREKINAIHSQKAKWPTIEQIAERLRSLNGPALSSSTIRRHLKSLASKGLVTEEKADGTSLHVFGPNTLTNPQSLAFPEPAEMAPFLAPPAWDWERVNTFFN